TRNDRQIDIVISVTPRVLRAPTVTPRDEEMRPSGTLQSPTTGSLAEMVREADREDQIAAARTIPRNVTGQLPDAPVEVAPQSNPPTQAANTKTAAVTPQSNPSTTVANTTTAVVPKQAPAVAQKTNETVEELPSFIPAPKPLVSDRAASEVATLN